MLEILVRAALCTLLLALMVQLGLWGLRVRHPKLQLAAWTAVLLASLAMPAVPRLMPAGIPATLTWSWLPATMTGPTIQAAPMFRSERSQQVSQQASMTRAVQPPRRLTWWDGLSGGYALVAALLLLRMLLGLVLSWKLLRATQPVRADWAAGQRLRSSTWICSPCTIGTTVLLPAECVNWDVRRRLAVLAHEGAHAARGDFYVQLLSQVNRAVFWFSPLPWWLHRRLTALAELASDDDAIEVLGDRPSYAAILLDLARLPRLPAIGVAMGRTATVSQRIERILKEPSIPSRVGWLWPLVIALAVAPLALLAAELVANPAPSAAPRASVAPYNAPYQRIAIDPRLLDTYAGFYLNAATDSLMIVTREADHLLTRRAGNQPMPEYPYTDHDFFLTIIPQQNSFVTDATGAAIGVVHHQYGRDERLERISTMAAQQYEAARMKRLSEQLAPHIAVAIDPGLLDDYVGTYQIKPEIMLTLTRDGDRLLARLTGKDAHEIHPYGDRDFFATAIPAQLSFVPGPDGKTSGLVLHYEGRDDWAPRVDPHLAQALDAKLAEQAAAHSAIKIDPRLLDQYVGRYGNAQVEITAASDGGQLFVQVTGYLRYAVFPYTERDFFATFGPVQISFVTDDSGRATQMIRHHKGRDEVLTREDETQATLN